MSIEEKLQKALDSLESEPIIKDAKEKLASHIGKPITTKDLNDLIDGLPDIMVPEFREDFDLDIRKLLKVLKIVNRIRKRKTDKKPAIKTKMGGKAAKIAARRFQRRVEIAEFVLFRVHTPRSLFLPLFEGKPLPKIRIDWKATLKEWNETHPNPLDQMTDIHVFSSTYSRILKEDEVLQEILRRELAETEMFLQLVRSAVEAYKNIVAQLPSDYPIPPRARAIWEGLQNMVKEAQNER